MTSAPVQAPELEYGVQLSRYTSVRVGGPAALFTVARGSAELERAVRWALQEDVPYLVLGSGSNVVMSDAGFRGLVIKNISRGVAVTGEDESGAIVELESGTFLPTAARRLAVDGIAGLEWGVGIPGTCGGAVVGNAGAYGGVTAEILIEIDGLDSTGQPCTLTNAQLAFEYRASSIKRGEVDLPVVLRARYHAHRDDPTAIQQRIQAFLAERKRKQPVEPSVGSTFKNPEGTHAGILIERLGLKGTRVGGAIISPKHANYVVNTGTATASEIRELVDLVQRTVYEQTGIRLEIEIEWKGEW